MTDQVAEWEARAVKARVLLETHARDAREGLVLAQGRIEAAATRVTVSASAWHAAELEVENVARSVRMARECAERVECAEREAGYARREAAQESRR
jgi:hypothetical protein